MITDIYHEFIYSYIQMGMAPIPIKFRSKQPSIEGWPTLEIEPNNIDKYFIEPTNVGIVTGKPPGMSWGIVDVDIDDKEALKFAPYFLPETDCIFGRASKPASHWVYRVRRGEKRLSFSFDHMIIELRGDGCCTVFPPSVHETGEKIEFQSSKY